MDKDNTAETQKEGPNGKGRETEKRETRRVGVVDGKQINGTVEMKGQGGGEGRDNGGGRQSIKRNGEIRD